METYRTFNPKEFNTLVLSNFKNEKVYVNYDKCAKNLVMTTIKHSGYNVEDVYNHINCILTETYPDYQDTFRKKQWTRVYQSNIKKGGELAAKLQAVLETMDKRKNNDELREKFFLCVEEMGINTKILKMDMAIDLFGWIETLELICKLAGYVKDEKNYDKIKESKEKETSIVVETTIPVKRLEKKKLEKSGKKVSECLVAYYLNKEKQLDKAREIGRYTSQQDACNSLCIKKSVLSNYLNGRKASVFFITPEGDKVRIGFEKVAA